MISLPKTAAAANNEEQATRSLNITEDEIDQMLPVAEEEILEADISEGKKRS